MDSRCSAPRGAGPAGLPTGGRVTTREHVIRPAAAFDRLIAALCAALMLFYAATVPVKAADQIQHSPAFMVAHDHGNAGRFIPDTVHDSIAEHAGHHGGASVDDKGTGGDHPAGGHHHHGDTGPSLLVPNAIIAAGLTPPASMHGIGKDRRIAGLRPVGPERPPRLRSLTA